MNDPAFAMNNPVFWILSAVVLLSWLALRLWLTRGQSGKHHGWQSKNKTHSYMSHFTTDHDQINPLFPPPGEPPQSFEEREESNR